jgi:hypothetical protein
VASRLEVIEKVIIDYEIPYVSDRGESVNSTTVQINEWRQGIGISYALLECTEQNLDTAFPSAGVDYLVHITKHILRDLGMNPSRVILQLWEYSTIGRTYSVEGRAPVNRERDTVLIILTKSPFVYKFGYELVLWHQAMHAKDRLENRFPSAHPLVEVGEWLDILWHFSIDGRLQRMGKTHYSKEERRNEAAKALPELGDRLTKLCDELWGKEVTFSQLLKIGKELGLKD